MTIDSRNKLFTVAVLYRSLRDGRYLPSNLWEESMLLIRAVDEQEARVRAEAIAKGRSSQFANSAGEVIRWEFASIECVYELEVQDVVDGTELFSRHLRASEVQSLLTPFSDD